MPLDTIFLMNSTSEKTSFIFESFNTIAPALSALVVGVLAYIGIVKTSKSQINSSLLIVKHQLFSSLILSNKNKWKDDLMDSISKLLTAVDPDVCPIENGKLLVNMNKIVHLIFRIQLLLNPVKFISHKNLNDNLSKLGKAMAGYHGSFLKNELLALQNSIFESSRIVANEVWDEIQNFTNSTKKAD